MRATSSQASVAMEQLDKDLHWGGHLNDDSWKTLTQSRNVHSLKGAVCQCMSVGTLQLEDAHTE